MIESQVGNLRHAKCDAPFDLAQGRLRARYRFSRADAPEHESGLGLYNLAIHLEQGVGKEINWTARRLGIDDQIRPLVSSKRLAGL